MNTINFARIEPAGILLDVFAQPFTQAVSELLRLNSRG